MESQIIFLLKLRKQLGLENGKLYDMDGKYNENGLECLHTIQCSKGLNKDRIEAFKKEYKAVFRCGIKAEKWEKIDFTIPKECEKFLYKIYTNLFGDDILANKKTTQKIEGSKKRKSIVIYKKNDENFEYHKKLYMFRNKEKQDKTWHNDEEYLINDEENPLDEGINV